MQRAMRPVWKDQKQAPSLLRSVGALYLDSYNAFAAMSRRNCAPSKWMFSLMPVAAGEKR